MLSRRNRRPSRLRQNAVPQVLAEPRGPSLYERPLGRGRHLHVGFLGAGDRMAFKSSTSSGKESERSSYFEPQLCFHRFDLGYRAKVGDTSILLTPALRLDSNRIILENYPELERSPAGR